MNLRRHMVLFSLLSVVQPAQPSGSSYMDLVGQLFGSVESPRLIRDFCAARSPGTASENARLYDDWRSRHLELLEAVAIQVAHAEVRLAQQDPPADAKSFDQIRSNMAAQLAARMKEKSPEWIVQFCSTYPRFIEKKDEETRTAIQQLLSTVEHADKELTSRSKPNTSLERTGDR